MSPKGEEAHLVRLVFTNINPFGAKLFLLFMLFGLGFFFGYYPHCMAFFWRFSS